MIVLKVGYRYQWIDVVFDRYREKTIKSAPRKRRIKSTRPIRRLIEGRDSPMPKNWNNYLAVAENKGDPAIFLSNELCSQAPEDKEIVVAGEFRDEFEVGSSRGTIDINALKSTHEEADTRINVGIGTLTEETLKSAEAFVCRIYNVHTTDSVDSARHVLFSKTGKPESIPPTNDALRFHFMRAHYQAMVWRNAHCAMPNLPAPVEMGWKHGSIPGGFAPGFSHVRIVPDDAASRRVFSGISRFSRPFIPALFHKHLSSPSSTLNALLSVSTGKTSRSWQKASNWMFEMGQVRRSPDSSTTNEGFAWYCVSQHRVLHRQLLYFNLNKSISHPEKLSVSSQPSRREDGFSGRSAIVHDRVTTRQKVSDAGMRRRRKCPARFLRAKIRELALRGIEPVSPKGEMINLTTKPPRHPEREEEGEEKRKCPACVVHAISDGRFPWRKWGLLPETQACIENTRTERALIPAKRDGVLTKEAVGMLFRLRPRLQQTTPLTAAVKDPVPSTPAAVVDNVRTPRSGFLVRVGRMTVDFSACRFRVVPREALVERLGMGLAVCVTVPDVRETAVQGYQDVKPSSFPRSFIAVKVVPSVALRPNRWLKLSVWQHRIATWAGRPMGRDGPAHCPTRSPNPCPFSLSVVSSEVRCVLRTTNTEDMFQLTSDIHAGVVTVTQEMLQEAHAGVIRHREMCIAADGSNFERFQLHCDMASFVAASHYRGLGSIPSPGHRKLYPAVAQQAERSPPTKGEQGSIPDWGCPSDFARGNRAGRHHWSAGFLGVLPFPPLLRSGAAPYSPRSAHIGAQNPVFYVLDHNNAAVFLLESCWRLRRVILRRRGKERTNNISLEWDRRPHERFLFRRGRPVYWRVERGSATVFRKVLLQSHSCPGSMFEGVIKQTARVDVGVGRRGRSIPMFTLNWTPSTGGGGWFILVGERGGLEGVNVAASVLPRTHVEFESCALETTRLTYLTLPRQQGKRYSVTVAEDELRLTIAMLMMNMGRYENVEVAANTTIAGETQQFSSEGALQPGVSKGVTLKSTPTIDRQISANIGTRNLHRAHCSGCQNDIDWSTHSAIVSDSELRFGDRYLRHAQLRNRDQRPDCYGRSDKAAKSSRGSGHGGASGR
ncbi:hypothetical protein PR048_007850 [Dryococelus australis]|uniref:Uncharacterized protein n=1 Tax=Dryococelus australis TaxID=614101 RepID=A0ABQ9HVF0_9NEOP|nr:hypothetical protein PR048_007850 [Dryococelus australis]